MDEDNLSKAIMIGVTTLVGVMTISAIIIFFNSSLNIVRNVGTGKDFSNVNRNDIESTLLMSDTGNYIKGTSVINLFSYYEQNVNVTISVHNIKYLDKNGNIQVLDLISMESNDVDVRKNAYNRALRYIMDNQDFTISVQDIDIDAGSKVITIRGV
ncbi:MAG: hypothetical protein ACI4ON_02830 [Clostridia bacterium]